MNIDRWEISICDYMSITVNYIDIADHISDTLRIFRCITNFKIFKTEIKTIYSLN